MLTLLNAQERSREDFEQLLAETDPRLRLVDVHMAPMSPLSLVEVVLEGEAPATNGVGQSHNLEGEERVGGGGRGGNGLVQSHKRAIDADMERIDRLISEKERALQSQDIGGLASRENVVMSA